MLFALMLFGTQLYCRPKIGTLMVFNLSTSLFSFTEKLCWFLRDMIDTLTTRNHTASRAP